LGGATYRSLGLGLLVGEEEREKERKEERKEKG
jgi:hypothetical protein